MEELNEALEVYRRNHPCPRPCAHACTGNKHNPERNEKPHPVMLWLSARKTLKTNSCRVLSFFEEKHFAGIDHFLEIISGNFLVFYT